MKKVITGLTVFIMMFTMFLTGCGDTVDLPEDVYDKAKIEEKTQEAINDFTKQDFEGLRALCNKDAASKLGDSDLSSAYDQILGKAGEFKEFTSCTIAGKKQNDKVYAVVIETTKYENSKITYTLAFDENMEIIQFFLK